MREIRTSGSMSGDGKRSVAAWPKLPRPSSTLPQQPPQWRPVMSPYGGVADITPMGWTALAAAFGRSIERQLRTSSLVDMWYGLCYSAVFPRPGAEQARSSKIVFMTTD